MSSNVITYDPQHRECPTALRRRLGKAYKQPIAAIGNIVHLDNPLLAFFCSGKCPGNLILDTYDLARELRDIPVTVIGGFHSSMEKECLDMLLRGTQPIIICPARSIDRMRIPKPWQAPLADGRLLIVSPFIEHQPRVTVELARQRNRFVAHLADEVFIAHAAPGSKTESFCKDLLDEKKPVLAVNRPENSALLELGAQSLAVSDASKHW